MKLYIAEMRKLILLFLITLAGYPVVGHAQKVAVKTNLLYGAYTYTPNLGLEVRVGKKLTLDVGVGYNPWNRHGTAQDNEKLLHVLAEAELRYWLCQPMNGHFFGVHALGSRFNIGEKNLPLLLGKDSENYRFQGNAVGAGLSYGYQWMLGKRWNLEATIGVGYARLKYDRYECKKCGEKLGTENRNYLGPTKAGISLIYIIK